MNRTNILFDRDVAWAVYEELCREPVPTGHFPTVQSLVIPAILKQELGIPKELYEIDFCATNNEVLRLSPKGTTFPGIVVDAHRDRICAVAMSSGSHGSEVELDVRHERRTKRDWPAVAYRFQSWGRVRVALGTLGVRADKLVFIVGNGDVLPQDVVMYDWPAELVDGEVRGADVNSGIGLTAALIAAAALYQMGVKHVAFAFTDGSESSPISNETLATGARLLARMLPTTTTYIVVDGHEISGALSPPIGALLARGSSADQGFTVPATLFHELEQGAYQELATSGLVFTINPRLPSSSNAIGYMLGLMDQGVKPSNAQITILGIPGWDLHFNDGVPTALLDDVMHGARAIVASVVALLG